MNKYEDIAGKEARQCVNCKFYVQHYVRDGRYEGGYAALNTGHCIKAKGKRISRRQMGVFDWCVQFEGKDGTVDGEGAGDQPKQYTFTKE